MTATRASAEDATHVYILTIAYLHDAIIGNVIPASTLHVKEEWGDIFYIWRRPHSSAQEEPIAPATPYDPVAMCTYKMVPKTWKVELSSGETLTLIDKGDVWGILWDAEMVPLLYIPKRQGRRRTRGRRQTPGRNRT